MHGSERLTAKFRLEAGTGVLQALSFQVFVSYASRDDTAPPGGGDGFVTTFVKYLKFDLDQRKPTPEIWRDKDGRIKPSDQFDEVIQKGIAGSGVLLVLMSDNWMDRTYCRKELDLFGQANGGPSAKHRIIVAAKHYMEPQDRPTLLQGQTAYKFYDDEDPEKPEFFMRAKRNELALVIEKIANDLRDRALEHDPTEHREGPAPRQVTGRKIYLAKPATDMRMPYERLVEELQHPRRGYVVVPDPNAEIPLDSTGSATAFIDTALDGAEIAIHLLGEKPGRAPDDAEATPIVKLQLTRAALRAAVPAKTDAGAFRRLIWAPEILTDQPQAQSDAKREPLDVLARFDRKLDTDKVDGSSEIKFTEFVIQHLTNRVLRPSAALDVLESNSRVYVYYRREDEDYALCVADALKKRQVQPIFPIFDDTDAEVTAWHRKQLAECDAVVVCWASAGEVWVTQQTPEWKDWHKLGREKRFTYRGVIAGPPADRKQSYMKKYSMQLLPPNEVDIVLDLSAYDKPPPEALDPLVRAAASAEETGVA